MADIGRNLNSRLSTMRISCLVIVVVVLTAGCVNAKFGADDSVCNLGTFAANAQTNPGPKKPTLPPQWTVRIEGNIMESNYTQDIQEFYDGLDNKGAVFQYIGGLATQMIFLYPTNELITLTFDNSGNPPRCHVDDLAKSSAKNLFGLIQGVNGSEHIFSANQALRFGGNIPEVYIGRAEAHNGVIVDAWESCMYWDSQDATFHLTWYFSANNTWTSAINKVVPVEALLEGKIHVNSSYTVNILRKYIFTDFRPVLFYGPIGAFETPVGTYCMHRVSKTPLRNVTDMFTFTAEIFEPQTSYINWIKEYYDWELNLVRYDYTPDPNSGSQYGNGKLLRVHDFNTGVAYILDALNGNCSVSPISALGFDAKSLDAGKVRMRTSKEFFYFDKVHYEYAGQRLARGITCDVWVAIRHDYPPGYAAPQSTWEWYFASPQWMENVGKTFEFLLPIMLQVTSTNPPMDIIYNIYDYSESNPNIWKTDISACFNYTHKKNFQLSFPGDYRDNIANDVGDFKFALLQTIVAIGGVSPLRISNTQVDYTTGDIVVSFTILDKAPIQGDINIQGSFNDRPLSDVVSAITSQVQTNKFIVLLDPTKFPNVPGGQVTAKQYSAKSWDVKVDTIFGTPGSQGYSGGAMGGLAVAMIIIGIALGFGILFVVYKMRGGSFAPPGFTPKTFTDTKDSKEME